MSNSVKLGVEAEYSTCTPDRQHVNVLIGIEGPSSPDSGDISKAHQEIVAIIDTSGSMSGEKIKLVKKSLSFLSEQLTDNDTLSIVSFDTEARLILKMCTMDSQGKRNAASAIQLMGTKGMTNLSGGIILGFEQFNITRKDSRVSSMVIFTDGMANRGITETKELCQLVSNLVETIPESLAIFTIGYGEDYNSDAMRAISEQTTGGVSHHISNTDMMSDVINGCFGGLLSVCAQVPKLTISTHMGVAFSFLSKVKYEKKEGHGIVELGDICFGENRDLVLDVRISESDFPTPVISLSLSYFNISTLQVETTETTLIIPRKHQPCEQNKNVSRHVARVKCSKDMETASACLKSANPKEAQTHLEQARDLIDELDWKSDKMLSALREDVEKLLKYTKEAIANISRVSFASVEADSASQAHERQFGNDAYDGGTRQAFKQKAKEHHAPSASNNYVSSSGPYDDMGPQPRAPTSNYNNNVGPYDIM